MRLLLALLLLPAIGLAEPLNLAWDKVTQAEDGSVLPTPPKYRLYRQACDTCTWKVVAEREGNWFVWYLPTPAYAHYKYRVTAYNEFGESDPSNEVRVFVDTKPKEEP